MAMYVYMLNKNKQQQSSRLGHSRDSVYATSIGMLMKTILKCLQTILIFSPKKELHEPEYPIPNGLRFNVQIQQVVCFTHKSGPLQHIPYCLFAALIQREPKKYLPAHAQPLLQNNMLP